MDDACVSGKCSGAVCVNAHSVAAGQTCAVDLDCDYFASCGADKKCTPSGLEQACDPTLGGADMTAQCQGSTALYCSCGGKCLAIDTATQPTSSGASTCQQAKDAVAGSGFKDLTKINVLSLSATQQTNIAIDQCCRNCDKEDRVSKLGFAIDCATNTITQGGFDPCGLFANDPIALSGCPSKKGQAGSSNSNANSLYPVLWLPVLAFCL